MLFVALFACDRTETPPPPVQVDLVEDCDPEIHIPGVLGAIDPAAPDPHSETFGPAPEPYQVRINWPSSDPAHTISFLWRTDVDTLASVVEYGIGSDLSERIEGASFRYGGTAAAPGPQRIHEAKICGGLEPGTTYSYRVGGEGHWSPIMTFTTPGEPDSFDSFRVAILGDSRGAYETWGELLSAVASHEPDFVLFGGDMVEFGANQGEWDAWFGASGDLMQGIPFLPAHGNHEFMAPHYFAQWSLPGNEQWYTIRFGPLQLVVLNDTVTDMDSLEAQADFIDSAFADSTATWRMAMHHQSLYATCTTHGSNVSLRDLWAPRYEANGLQIVINGHNHIYERSVPIAGDQQVPQEQGVTYLVTGGAGADLYTNFAEAWFGLVANPVEHYVIADFGPTQADFVVRDLAGNVIDAFTLAP